MDLNPIMIGIPMFFGLMALELVYEGIHQNKSYRFNDAITNINTGILQQISGTFLVFFQIGILILVYENIAPFHLPSNIWTFIIVMILWDLAYYWYHRMSHRISLFWGGHSVHHQSEEYNLSVALRQTSTGFLWGIPFYVPIALIGFDPHQIVLAGGLNLLYQFWIHTEHIDKLPKWFEAIFNTPSHHRVHHGKDPKYIDKNYAGILIIWDKLFGTFTEEEERPHYGTTKPLASWNPVYANFAHYIWMSKSVKKARNMGDALKIIFKPPGWLPDYLGGTIEVPEVDPNYKKFDRHNTAFLNYYALFQFVGFVAVNLLFLFSYQNFAWEHKLLMAAWIVVSAVMMGMFFEKDAKKVFVLENIRLATLPVLLWYINPVSPYFAFYFGISAIVFGIISLSLFSYFELFKNSKPQVISNL